MSSLLFLVCPVTFALGGCGAGGSVAVVISKAGLCTEPGAGDSSDLVLDHAVLARGAHLGGKVFVRTACTDQPLGDSCQAYAMEPATVNVTGSGPVHVSPSGQVPVSSLDELSIDLIGEGAARIEARADNVGSGSVDLDIRPIDHFGVTWVAAGSLEKPLEGLLFEKGATAVLAVRARDKNGAHLCGGEALVARSANGASFAPADAYDVPSIEANSMIAMTAATSDIDTVELAADGAVSSVSLDLVDAGAIDVVRAEFSSKRGSIALSAFAGGREVAGASYKIEILTPGIAAFGVDASTGPEQSVTTREELVGVNRIADDGKGVCLLGCGPAQMIRVRVSVVGSSATTEIAFSL